MKKLMTKLVFLSLVAFTLAGGVSTAFANHDATRQNQWHLDDGDRSRFEAIETGDNNF